MIPSTAASTRARCTGSARPSSHPFARAARFTSALLAIVASAASAQGARHSATTLHDGAATPAATLAPVGVEDLPSVGMTVSNMDHSIAFYRDVLGFRVTSDAEVAGSEFEHLTGVFGSRARVVRLRLADETLELTEYLVPRGRPIPVDSRSNDEWFQHVAIIVRDMNQAYARLRANHVEHASSGPQRLPDWNPNAGGIEAFYFKDPDQHVLEILHFPDGKGSAKWHRNAGDTLFLGIDHTAIVSRDTERSLAFYRDVLGMKVAGASENYGTEQEHLNNVFGAHLRITALRASAGPGVELLEYLAPRDGRPYPADVRANDLLHWESTLAIPDAERAIQRLRLAAVPVLTGGVIALSASPFDFSKAFVVRDPDGHVVRLAERR